MINYNGECVFCGKKITIFVKSHWGICHECAEKRGWDQSKKMHMEKALIRES
jgi:hypothetical protein